MSKIHYLRIAEDYADSIERGDKKYDVRYKESER